MTLYIIMTKTLCFCSINAEEPKVILKDPDWLQFNDEVKATKNKKHASRVDNRP